MLRWLLVAFVLLMAGPALADTTTLICYKTATSQNCVPVSSTAPLPVASSPSGSTTPAAGTSFTIATGGTPVTVVTGPVNGCYIVNPLSATDQGIAAAEVAQVNPVTTASSTGNGTTTTLQPGQPFYCIPGQTTNVSAVAATNGHKLTVVKW